jgi:hypothetical protein
LAGFSVYFTRAFRARANFGWELLPSEMPFVNRHRRAFARLATAASFTAVSALLLASSTAAQTSAAAPCTIKQISYDGFDDAQELSNAWVKLVFVPQLGGRLMQVTFAGHDYLFVNPEFKGRHIPPPDDPRGKWFNYGGDKIWPMPEGEQDADHWPGPLADPLDDGTYTLKPLEGSHGCGVQLEGPADPRTGLQYSREITIDADSPQIHFHAVMKNASDHPIKWSMQSVSQYNTSDANDSTTYNKNFWAFSPVNPKSAYFTQFQVRDGLADDPSFEVTVGSFCLHWLPLQNEVWLDSNADWIAVVDRTSHFAMVERFEYHAGANYPGEATVIFYKNGPSFGLGKDGLPALHGKSGNGPGEDPFYMEAELNSPIVALAPGKTYAMDTTWHPTRVGDDFATVTAAGVVDTPLSITTGNGTTILNGTFGVFEEGNLTAVFLDSAKKQIGTQQLQRAKPDELAVLSARLVVPVGTKSIEIHVINTAGKDLGSLGDVAVSASSPWKGVK